MTLDDLTIDPEFRNLLPALSSEALRQLRDNIIRDGQFTDDLIAWPHNGTTILLDGHNRYDIWHSGDLPKRIKPPGIKTIGLPSREHALCWMELHADGQRNMTAQQKSLVRGRAYNRIKAMRGGWHPEEPKTEAAREKPPNSSGKTGENMKGQNVPSSPEPPRQNAAEIVAEATGTTTRTVKRDGAYAASLDRVGKVNPKFADDVKAGIVKLSKPDVTKIGKLPTDADIGKAVGNVRNGRPWDWAPDPEPECDEPSIEDLMKQRNTDIESFCRKLTAFFDDHCPDDEWLADLGRKEAASKKVKEACSTLRTGKCHALCPLCNGDGCKKCHNTGRVPKLNYDQMV